MYYVLEFPTENTTEIHSYNSTELFDVFAHYEAINTPMIAHGGYQDVKDARECQRLLEAKKEDDFKRFYILLVEDYDSEYLIVREQFYDGTFEIDRNLEKCFISVFDGPFFSFDNAHDAKRENLILHFNHRYFFCKYIGVNVFWPHEFVLPKDTKIGDKLPAGVLEVCSPPFLRYEDLLEE